MVFGRAHKDLFTVYESLHPGSRGHKTWLRPRIGILAPYQFWIAAKVRPDPDSNLTHRHLLPLWGRQRAAIYTVLTEWIQQLTRDAPELACAASLLRTAVPLVREKCELPDLGPANDICFEFVAPAESSLLHLRSPYG